MENQRPSKIHSAGLHIDFDSGLLSNEAGQSRKLGLVNMKVLQLLLDNSGEVVSRAAVFDQVWPNQEVSDDALTRCISDLRSSCKDLVPDTKFIETLPKRGYRWSQTYRALDLAHESNIIEEVEPSNRKLELKKPKLSFILYTSAFVAISLALIIALVIPRSNTPNIAIMNTAVNDSSLKELAVEIHEHLYQILLKQDQYGVISKNVISEIGSNYHSLNKRYKVRWIVETHLYKYDDDIKLSISTIDAKTSLIEKSRTINLQDDFKIYLNSQTLKLFD